MDASTILEVTRMLIGGTEPCGDSAIDRKRLENLNKLIWIVDDLVNDIVEVSWNKDRQEGSMRDMGQNARAALRVLLCKLTAILGNNE